MKEEEILLHKEPDKKQKNVINLNKLELFNIKCQTQQKIDIKVSLLISLRKSKLLNKIKVNL